MRQLPIFPLSSPLLPGMVLPLRLFEPRYLQLYADVIDDTRQFGVVLIERGMESRADSSTFDVGCIANIAGSGVNDDGTIGLITVGTRRIHIDSWLEPDPYPRAMVTALDEDGLSDEGLRAVQDAADLIPDLLHDASRLDPDVTTEVPELADDPGLAMYQVAQLAGLQALDLQEVLEVPAPDARARLIKEKVEETIELIRLQLEMRDG